MRKRPFEFKSFLRTSIILAMALMIFHPAGAQESDQTKTFIVIGTAPVQGTTVSAARETAIADGLVTAVALMTGELLESRELVENFPQLNQLLFNQSKDYIQGYKVLTEAAGGESYRVMVQVSVSGEKISKQLSDSGILRAQQTLPSVLVMIAEQNLEDPYPRYWWSQQGSKFQAVAEAPLLAALTKTGFKIIDHQNRPSLPLANWEFFDRPDLTDQEAAELGAGLQADLIILGTATASTSPNMMGSEVRSFTGTFAARVIRTDSGQKVLDFTRTALVAHEDETLGSQEALTEVGAMAGQSLAEELAVLWQKEAGKPSVVEVLIRGTGQLANYVKFRKALNTVSGVEGIRVKELKPNEATLLVEYQGSAKDLAAALMLQHFESFGIKIFEVTQNLLRIELIPG
jgi:hypothetical protein